MDEKKGQLIRLTYETVSSVVIIKAYIYIGDGTYFREVSAFGNSAAEAIGELIRCYPELFGVRDVVWGYL